jgi:hypothetical protein
MLTAAASAVAKDLPKPVEPTGPIVAVPLTIGQMAERARAKRIADDAAKQVPTAANSPTAGAAPAGMVIVPSSQIITGAGGAPGAMADAAAGTKKKPVVPEKKAPPPEVVPEVVSISRKGTVRTVELVEPNGSARFEVGQQTASGWTVMTIGSQRVEMGKIDPKTGVVRKVASQLNMN